MADGFACNPEVAMQFSGRLAEVRQDVAGGGGLRVTPGVTGSREVDDVLDTFVTATHRSRTNLLELLARAAGLMRGLSSGTTSLDGGLADVLRPSTTTVSADTAAASALNPTPPPNPTPNPTPSPTPALAGAPTP